jgi:hypothetical protein
MNGRLQKIRPAQMQRILIKTVLIQWPRMQGDGQAATAPARGGRAAREFRRGVAAGWICTSAPEPLRIRQ